MSRRGSIRTVQFLSDGGDGTRTSKASGNKPEHPIKCSFLYRLQSKHRCHLALLKMLALTPQRTLGSEDGLKEGVLPEATCNMDRSCGRCCGNTE